MDYKLAVFDLDGTLTNSRKELTPATQKALLELQERGVKCVLASGRPTYGIVPLSRQLQLAKYGGYILAYNGGVIVDCASGRELYSQTLPQRLIEPLYREANDAGCVMLSYREDEILCERGDDEYVQYEAMLNQMRVREVDSFVEAFCCDVPKCLAVGESSRAERLVERLQATYGEIMGIFRSEPFFVELVPKGVDKALSLARLCEIVGVRREQMIAFGDGFNDLTMIEYAGCGVAMGNAQERVRQVADVVTLTNEEDGVAHYLNKFML